MVKEDYNPKWKDLKPLGFGLVEYSKRNSLSEKNLQERRKIALRAIPLSLYHMATVVGVAMAVTYPIAKNLERFF